MDTTMGSLIKEHRKKVGLSQQALADKIGVSRMTVCFWETGRSKPETHVISKLCEVLDIPTGAIFGASREENVEERKLLNLYRNLNLSHQRILINMAETLYQEECLNENERLKEEFGIFGMTSTKAAAGAGNDYSSVMDGYCFLRRGEKNERATWVVTVDGPSMMPDYTDGEQVYVQERGDASPGDVVVVNTSDGLVIKRLTSDHRLESINRRYPFEGNANKEYEIVGKVVGKVTPYDRPNKSEQNALNELFLKEILSFKAKHGIVDEEG